MLNLSVPVLEDKNSLYIEMPLPKYIFKKEASDVIGKIIVGEDIWIGDHEEDPDMFYFNQGTGADAVMFLINQDTGLVEVKFSNPGRNGHPPYEGDNEDNDEYRDLGDDEDNNWYKSGVAENIKYYLQNLVVESTKGGKRKSRRNKRKSRKTRRRYHKK